MNQKQKWLLPKPIYRFNAVPTKIPTQFFSESEMKILNFIWIKKNLRISKNIIINLISDIMTFDALKIQVMMALVTQFFLLPNQAFQNFAENYYTSFIVHYKFLLKSTSSQAVSFLSATGQSDSKRKNSSIQIHIKMNFKAIQSIDFWQEFTYYEVQKNWICLSKQ